MNITLPGPNGTSATLESGDLDALAGHVRRLEEEGVRFALGCGCTGRVECGYHREQRLRVRS